MADPSSVDQYFADPILANPAGHEIIADVLSIVGFFTENFAPTGTKMRFGLALDGTALDAEHTARGVGGKL